ncbi:MAG: tail fiber domain-containing protein [Candidatus Electrothrix sp. LOE1_4_5]|nr:tail fiber domain-containing protein [Candidatus Electrothrix gigas]
MNTITGRVQSVKTDSEGKVAVVIDSTEHGTLGPAGEDGPLDNYFYSPKDMTEQQLAEFKRAQNGNLGIRLEFDDSRTITSMNVLFSALSHSPESDDSNNNEPDKEQEKSPLFIDKTTGNIGIGTDSIKQEQRLHVDGNLYVDGELRVTGHAYKDAGNEYWKKGTSDMRLKNEIPFGEPLKLLLALRGARYTWKPECLNNYPDDPLFDDKEHLGFIAQDIKQLEQLDKNIFSQWTKADAGHYVINSEEFDALGVYPDPEAFQALTVESIRELDQKIASLNQALTTVGTALANLQAEQLRQADRIKKLEEGR